MQGRNGIEKQPKRKVKVKKTLPSFLFGYFSGWSRGYNGGVLGEGSWVGEIQPQSIVIVSVLLYFEKPALMRVCTNYIGSMDLNA